MAKVRPDFSFDREGRPLSAWLLDFISEDASTRLMGALARIGPPAVEFALILLDNWTMTALSPTPRR